MWPSRTFWKTFVYCGLALLVSHFVVASVFSIQGFGHGVRADLPSPYSDHVWMALIVGNLLALGIGSWFIARDQSAQVRRVIERAGIVAEAAGSAPLEANDLATLPQLAMAINERCLSLARRIQQLEEDRGRLQAVLKSMVEGVVLIDAMQRIVFVNDAASRFLNVSSEEAAGKKLWQVVRHRQLAEAVQRILTTGESHRGEVEWNPPDGRVLEVHGARLPGAPMRGAVLVMHDITHLRHLERVRQDFVANVSHELKTPLAAIQATAETLLDGALNDPEHGMKFLTRIRENADRLHRLVLDLLTLGQIESGLAKLEIQTIDVAAAVDACLQRQEHRALAKSLTLAQEAPPEGLAIRADDDALAQILDNLVDNAIKYTPEGGRITVRWWAEEDEVCLAVSDTGVGIPEKDLGRIFERFYRVDKARSREVGGTGLGLSIVKHLVQALDGAIAATSQLGVGSTFTLRLPRSQLEIANGRALQPVDGRTQ